MNKKRRDASYLLTTYKREREREREREDRGVGDSKKIHYFQLIYKACNELLVSEKKVPRSGIKPNLHLINSQIL
jgi:hypothetical protein